MSESTIVRTARALRSVHPDHPAWFWFTELGPTFDPFLLVTDSRRDPDAAALAEEVAQVRAAMRLPAAGCRGTVQLGAGGELVFGTPDPPPDFLTGLGDFAARHQEDHRALIRLVGARLLLPSGLLRRDDAAWDGLLPEDIPAPHAAAALGTATALGRADDGDRLRFLLADRAWGGLPVFVVDGGDEEGHADRRAAVVAELLHGASLCVGTATRNAEGGLDLRGRAQMDEPLATLAAWVRRMRSLVPSLGRLAKSTWAEAEP